MVSLVLRALGLLFVLVAVCEGASPVTLKSRSGYTGTAPVRFRFSIGIETNPNNRLFCLQWASETSEGQSCDTLDGDKAPVRIWRDITFQTGGEFNVIAWVRQNNDALLRSNIETIRILDRFGS